MVEGIVIKSTSNLNEVLLNGQADIGSFLVYEENEEKLIYKIVSLEYRTEEEGIIKYSQAQKMLESKELNSSIKYLIAICKPICLVKEGSVKNLKRIAHLYSKMRSIREEDLSFLHKSGIFIGNVRDGSNVLKIEVKMEPKAFITHHVLITANTGKGKSNILKVMLWSLLNSSTVGAFVIDPHGEYYSVLEKNDNYKEMGLFYAPTDRKKGNSLIINVNSIMPSHFEGIFNLTDAQLDLAYLLFKEANDKWIYELFNEKSEYVNKLLTQRQIQAITLKTLQRKITTQLGLNKDKKGKVFTLEEGVGAGTIKNIVESVLSGKIVIIDTSSLYEEQELLITSIIANNLFKEKINSKEEGRSTSPVAIVLEEAPKVLGESIPGDNIFKKIAREGRKFGVGLIAVTQMASVIPKDILANMNTKIILGNDSALERNVIISIAPQDLSLEDREIATLEKGEGIISSSLQNIAIPFKAPLVETLYKKSH